MSIVGYEYAPLSGQRDFRLTKLHPGHWDGPIAIDIEHACLNDEQRPQYEALSYVWGPQYPFCDLQCNNSTISIVINLRDALRHIRTLDEAKTLWIDIQYPPPSDASREPVRRFLQRPWFSRIWTFQEIVLAQNAELRCGNRKMTWNHLGLFLMSLEVFREGDNNSSGLRGAGKAALEMLRCRVPMQRSTDEKEMRENLLYLLPLLDALREHKATDPRDTVFALLNLATDAKNSELQADYSKSPVEVYATTVHWLLRSQRTLAFLSLVEKKDKPDLISWIPDFRTKDYLNFLHQPLRLYRGPGHHIYRASGSTHAFISSSSDDDSLLRLPLRRILVGTIVARSSTPGNMTNNVAIGPAILSPQGEWPLFAASCADNNGRYSPTNEPIQLAYERTRA